MRIKRVIHKNTTDKLQTQNIFDDVQHEATLRCVKNGKYFTTGLLAAAWGFLFEEKQSYMCATLIVVIILSVIYFVWDTWRSFKVASKVRELWNNVDLGVYTTEQAKSPKNFNLFNTILL